MVGAVPVPITEIPISLLWMSLSAAKPPACSPNRIPIAWLRWQEFCTNDGRVLGAVGVAGEAGEQDEKLAVTGIEAAGFFADAG